VSQTSRSKRSYTSKLTRKAQITVPVAVREKLDLRPGDRGVWIVRPGEAVLVSARRYAAMTAGLLAGTYGATAEEVRRYLAEERDGW